MTDEDFMHVAIHKAQKGITAGQAPFGAVLVHGDMVLAAAHDTVWCDSDPTAHAEINAIRLAAQLRDANLSGCTMFTTCEPCPMCLAAIHAAKIDSVFFGAVLADAVAAGFGHLNVAATQLAQLGGSRLRLEEGLLRQECAALFAEWRAAGLSRPY